jgi:hypothetical protein
MGAAGISPPLATQVMRDIAGDDEATANLLRVVNHDVRPTDFFRPRRLGRAAARVARHRPRQIPAMGREVATAIRNLARRSRRRRDTAGGRPVMTPRD